MITYTLPGDPQDIIKLRAYRGTTWSSYHERKLIQEVTLQNQHGDLPLYTGPLSFEITCYMRITERDAKRNLAGAYHIYEPSSLDVQNMIVNCCKGLIVEKVSSISLITCKKIYDTNPRIEFTISSLTDTTKRRQPKKKL